MRKTIKELQKEKEFTICRLQKMYALLQKNSAELEVYINDLISHKYEIEGTHVYAYLTGIIQSEIEYLMEELRK